MLRGEDYPTICTAEDMRRLDAVNIGSAIQGTNVLDIMRQVVLETPDHLALKVVNPENPRDVRRTLNYRELWRDICRAALAFRRVADRERVIVSHILPICPEGFITMFGGSGAGGVNPINGFLEDWQIAQIIDAIGSRILVALGPDREFRSLAEGSPRKVAFTVS